MRDWHNVLRVDRLAARKEQKHNRSRGDEDRHARRYDFYF